MLVFDQPRSQRFELSSGVPVTSSLLLLVKISKSSHYYSDKEIHCLCFITKFCKEISIFCHCE